MRHLVALATGLVIETLLVFSLLLLPSHALASTGSPPTWSEWRHAAHSIFVATSEGPTSDGIYLLTVGPVLIGQSPGTVTYQAVANQPTMPRGSRWVVMTVPADQRLAADPAVLDGRWDPTHRIMADGRIDWGRIVDAPPTLTALLRSFGLPSTDAATAESAPSDETLPPLGILGALTVGGWLTLRLRSRSGTRPPAAPKGSR